MQRCSTLYYYTPTVCTVYVCVCVCSDVWYVPGFTLFSPLLICYDSFSCDPWFGVLVRLIFARDNDTYIRSHTGNRSWRQNGFYKNRVGFIRYVAPTAVSLGGHWIIKTRSICIRVLSFRHRIQWKTLGLIVVHSSGRRISHGRLDVVTNGFRCTWFRNGMLGIMVVTQTDFLSYRCRCKRFLNWKLCVCPYFLRMVYVYNIHCIWHSLVCHTVFVHI